MIAKDGDKLTSKMFQKIVSKLAEQIDPNKKQGIQLRAMNMSPLDQSVSISSVLAAHVAGDHVPAVPSKRELKTWDELTLRSREARLKLGVDHLRAALETLREIVGMCDEDLQPSSLDELLAAVLEKGVEHSVQPLSLSYK